MKREMKLVLVTGASGFLGRAVTTELLSRGCAVRALVRSPQKAEPLSRLGAEIVVGDIRDSVISTAFLGVDTVIHCAAAIGPASLPHEVFHSVNVNGTRNLVEALKTSPHLERFVHISTVAVIGRIDPRNPAHEGSPCRPIDAYGETKLLAEKVVLDAVGTGFPAAIVRPMWIYGTESTVTTNLFRKIARRKLPMIGAARNTMQPVAIEDTVAGIMKCAVTVGIEGRIYNIAGAEILTINSICKTIADLMGTTLPKPRIPMWFAAAAATASEMLFPIVGMPPPLTHQKLEFFHICNSYSIERARGDLDWNPQISFQQGARNVAEKVKMDMQSSTGTSRQ
jgi:nucleoside-diphosphate-sugar epimerase